MEESGEIVEPIEPEHQPSSLASLFRAAAMAQGQSYQDIAFAIGADPDEVQRLFTEGPTNDDAMKVWAHKGRSEAQLRRLYTRMARKHSEWTAEEQRGGVEICVNDILEARARLR